jgi:phage/conjugal plasmid C-4 type zinc finger TraR family protein
MREYESIQGDNLEEADQAQLLSVTTTADAVAKLRASIPRGPSLLNCEDCGEEIPEARRKVVMGCRMCIECQQFNDKRKQLHA